MLRPKAACSCGPASCSSRPALPFVHVSNHGNCTASPSIRLTRQINSAPPPAQAGGGGYSGSIPGGRGGGGGGGGGSSDDGSSSNNNGSKIIGTGVAWQGWRDRVAADPEFPFKVLLEQVIGVGACVVGDMSSRPNWGLNELDFVFSTLVVGSMMNFALMYLLAPTKAAAGASAGSFLTRALGDHYLKRWGVPGGNMFEAGNYSVASRLLNLAYKGTMFATIGLLAGVFGTATSNGLLLLRKTLDPSFEAQNTPPDVMLNALCWSAHMGISSNLRYQLLGGTDKLIAAAIPGGAFRVYSALIRGANNVLGGISFVTLARIMGVQKSAEPVVATS